MSDELETNSDKAKDVTTDLLPILMSNLSRIHSNIIFADTKAVAVSLVNSSLLGVLFLRIKDKIALIAEIEDTIASNADWIWSFQTFSIILSFIVVALLLFSIFRTVNVLLPRAVELMDDELEEIQAGVIDPIHFF